jgi:hypothetical protein
LSTFKKVKRWDSSLSPSCQQFSPVFNGVSVALAYIVSQGDITTTILWMAISTGVTAGLSYYKEKQ